MTITDVRVRKICYIGKMRGIVSVTFDDAFVIHDVKIIEGQNGYFIAMPSRKTSEGEFKDICHPITSALRSELQAVVLEAYEKALSEAKAETVTEDVTEDVLSDGEADAAQF